MSTLRTFRAHVPDADIHGLRVRLAGTRWPDEINDQHWSYGTRADYLRELTAYWRDGFDWRAAEAALNAFDQYLLDIDGLDLHFIHQRSTHRDATPLILTHGWPGSVVEFLDAIPRLTQPERFGGRAEDAFHVVCPSLPGYGFSAAARAPGMHPQAIARRHARLMQVLGYERYVAQGGDWGSPITRFLAAVDPRHCRAIHLNVLPVIVPRDVADPMSLLTERERGWVTESRIWRRTGMAYFQIQSTRPQTLAYALNDSPAGLCAWIAEKFHFWTDSERDGVRDIRNAVSWDRLLANISLYWFTGTFPSSIRLYREFQQAIERGEIDPSAHIATPVGAAIYPGETLKMPRPWAERNANIVHWFEADRGGHFAAMEQPQLFAADLWRFHAAVRHLLH